MKPLPIRTSACGPSLSFSGVRCLVPASAPARRREGRGHSADCLPWLRLGALRCSASWPVAELTSLAALATFKQAATSMLTKRADARGQQACASRRRTRRCARTPPVALRATVVLPAATATPPSAKARPGRPLRACEAPRSTGVMAARASALRHLTRRSCLSAANEVSEASSATGHEPEHRRAVGRRPIASVARCGLPGRAFAAPMPRQQTSSFGDRPHADPRSARVSSMPCSARDARRSN